MTCQHCGHPIHGHGLWNGDRDTRDVLGDVARFCHDCTHPVCEHAHQLTSQPATV